MLLGYLNKIQLLKQRYYKCRQNHCLLRADTAGPATNLCGPSHTSLLIERIYSITASFLIDPHLVTRLGKYLNHSWTCELQLAVRPSEYDLFCCCWGCCYKDAWEAGTLKKRKVTLEPWTLKTSSLEEWTLEEFNSLRLFLCDLDWFARSSSVVVSLTRKGMIRDTCTKNIVLRMYNTQNVASILRNSKVLTVFELRLCNMSLPIV